MSELLNKVTQGDCLEVMRSLEDNSVNLIVIDPPYNIGIKGEAWDKYKPEDYYAFMLKVFKECERVLKPNGSFYWFHNDMPKIARLMTDIDKDTEFVFNSFITWDKGDWRALSWKNPSDKSNLRSWFNTAEYCLLYTFQDETGSNAAAQAGVREYLRSELAKFGKAADINRLFWKNGWAKEGSNIASHFFGNNNQNCLPTKENYSRLQTTGYFTRDYESLRQEYESLRQEYESMRYVHNLDADHKNVWRYKTENTGKYHACQKPLTLIERLIRTSSNEGDVVLDCFLGSGTTAVAAINTNRNFIGIEREPEYVEIANRRIAEALERKATQD